jgi:hypothetical protein
VKRIRGVVKVLESNTRVSSGAHGLELDKQKTEKCCSFLNLITLDWSRNLASCSVIATAYALFGELSYKNQVT